MKIIEKITKNELPNNPNEIQKICLDKLKLNPLPDTKSEFWRLSNKSKLTDFLGYKFDDSNANFEIPYQNDNENIIRIIIGEKSSINIKKENYSIKSLKNKELFKYIEKNISYFDQNENWSDLLNLCLSSEQNILGLKINGSTIPPIEILSHSFNNSFNAKTLVVLVEKNCNVDLLQINICTTNSSLSQSTYFCLEDNSSVNHGVVSYGKNKSNLLNSLNVIQQPNSEYNLGSLHFKLNYARLKCVLSKQRVMQKQISKECK